MRSVGEDIIQCTTCGEIIREGIPHDCKIKNEAWKKGMKFDGGGDDKSEMKLRYDLIPWECIEELCKVYTYGVKKYGNEKGDSGWREVEDFENRYWSALIRHLMAWKLGEVCDQESGLRHLAQAMWNIVALLWKEKQK